MVANNNEKDVNLRIRATDESAGTLKGSEKNVRAITSALKDQAAAAERAAEAAAGAYNATSKALEEAQNKAVQARRAYDDFSKSLVGVGEPSRKQVREFEKLGNASERADAQVEKLAGRLAKAEAQFNKKFSLYEAILGDDADRAKAERGSLALATAIEQAEEAQRRLAGLNAFRKIGEDAEASALRLNTFGGAASSMDNAVVGLAASLRKIIDPSADARQSLTGLEDEVERVTAFIGKADKPMREYGDALLDLGRIQNDLMRQGAAVDAYRQQEAAVEGARQAFANAQADVLRYSAAIKSADAPNDALTANLREAEAALTTANRALEQQEQKLLRLRAPLKAAGIDVANLAREEDRLTIAATKTAKASEALNKAGSAGGGKLGFLGLKPYELTNLGYQLNDVFTQIASGTSVMQTFAQQGPQILQIFPQLLTGALAAAPAIAAVTAVLAPLVLGVSRLVALNAAQREFSAALTISADGARYSAAGLRDNAEALTEYGIKLSDAKAALSAFVSVGADPAALEGLTKTALDFADATGIKLPEAVEKMKDSFFGGMDGIDALDKSLNFLTATEREHIQALFDSGDAEGARTEALRIFTQRMDDAADKNRSNWQVATRQLTASWNDFLNGLANSGPIVRAIQWIDRTINGVRELLGWMNQLNRIMSAPINSLKIDAKGNISLPEPPRPARAGGTTTAALTNTDRLAKAEARLREEYQKSADQQAKTNRIENARREAMRKAAAQGLDNAGQARIAALAVAAEQKKIDEESAKSGERAGKRREAANRKAAAAAKREQAEAEAAIRKREAAEAQLVRGVEQMQARAQRNQRGDVEAAVGAVRKQYAELSRDLDAFQAKYGKGAKIGDQTVEALRQQITDTETLLEQQAELKARQEGLKDLEAERADTFAKIAQAQDDGRMSAEEAFKATTDAQAVLGPQIAKMAADAIAWAEAINAARPSKEMTSFIAEMKRVQGDATATGPRSESGGAQLAVLSKAQGALNATIAERNARIQTTNELFKAGAITAADAEGRIRAAVDGTTKSINDQIAAITELARGMVATGAMTATQFDALVAKLQLVGVTAQTVVTPVTEMRQQLEQAFGQGVLQVFDTAAQGIAGLIDGTMSFRDAIGSVWDAFRQFAADFLRQIAMMIIQQMIFNALKAAAESSGGGIFSSVARMIVGTKHTGGMGYEAPRISRSVDPRAFLNAPRYHTGYTPDLGIRSDETAAIIKKNEEVLTEDNPRHIRNWNPMQPASQTPQDIKVINTLDPGEFISKGLESRSGQRAIINFMRANPNALGNK